MSNAQRRWLFTAAATLVATGLAMPSAYAFNPQPDPPAKLKGTNSGNDKAFIWFEQDPGKLGGKNTASPGPCKAGASCQNPLPQFNNMQPKK